MVPSEFEFPDVQYEILEKCYIPTDDERELEEAAFINAVSVNLGPQAEVVSLFAPDTTASTGNEYRNVITA